MINTQTPDTREIISIDITDEEFLVMAKAAHELDITFNQFVEKALTEAIKNFELEPKA